MSRPQDKRLPYMPGIDALRAIAVLAVFLYHAGVGWMPGGFLGVDVFFVISGYLITSLLLSEYAARGPRRPLAASGCAGRGGCCPRSACCIAVVAWSSPRSLDAGADAAAARRRDRHRSATSPTGTSSSTTSPTSTQFQRPSLFHHLWSLSVEEQFYLFWPLVFAAGMSLFGRRKLLRRGPRRARSPRSPSPGSCSSRALTPRASITGPTPTRSALLAGVALALVWTRSGSARGPRAARPGRCSTRSGSFAVAFVVAQLRPRPRLRPRPLPRRLPLAGAVHRAA